MDRIFPIGFVALGSRPVIRSKPGNLCVFTVGDETLISCYSAMMAKKKATKNTDAGGSEVSFEESFDALRKVLAEMESGNLSLTESMAKYEEGVRLLRTCHEKLGKAKTKIEMLLKVDKEGNPVTKPFEHKATVADQEEAEEEVDKTDPNWDGGLF